MTAPIGRFPDNHEKMAILINKLGSAYQNYTTARTAIRDYVINMDEKYYVQVKQRISLAIGDLVQAESAARDSEIQETIGQVLSAVHDWGAIATQVQVAFSHYQETVKSKILANFSALTDAGNALVRINAVLMTEILLDLQAAHATVTAYLSSGQEAILASAYTSMNAIKTKIERADHNDKNLETALNTFSITLDTYVDGLRRAATHREKAHHFINDNLAPLGTKTQGQLEELYRLSIEQQQRNNAGD